REQQLNTLFSMDDFIREWRAQNLMISMQMQDDFSLIAQKASMVVRVLLLSTDQSSVAEWRFISEKGFLVDCIDESDQLIMRKKCSAQQIVMCVANGALLCNGKKVPYAL